MIVKPDQYPIQARQRYMVSSMPGVYLIVRMVRKGNVYYDMEFAGKRFRPSLDLIGRVYFASMIESGEYLLTT